MQTAPTSSPTTRLGRDDWLALGLERLAAQGPRALRLERLCDAAGRTRGSFYHHFANHARFLEALCEHWRSRQAEALVALSLGAPVGDGPRPIRRLATTVDPALELGMRRLGAAHPGAQAVVDEIDRRRLDALGRLHGARPGVTANQAAGFAWLEYAAYVGSQLLWPDAGAEELARTGDLLSDCIATITEGAAE